MGTVQFAGVAYMLKSSQTLHILPPMRVAAAVLAIGGLNPDNNHNHNTFFLLLYHG